LAHFTWSRELFWPFWGVGSDRKFVSGIQSFGAERLEGGQFSGGRGLQKTTTEAEKKSKRYPLKISNSEREEGRKIDKTRGRPPRDKKE